jgi:hypothetical protein
MAKAEMIAVAQKTLENAPLVEIPTQEGIR